MKFLSVKSTRTVAILLTLINALVFIYVGNKYGYWIETGLVNLMIQMLILIFYLLVHIYFVWLNEQFSDLKDDIAHRNSILESKLRILNDNSSELSNSISDFKKVVAKQNNENSEFFNNKLKSLNSRNSIVLNQLYDLHTTLNSMKLVLIPGLKNQLEILNKKMVQSDQLQNIYDQLLNIYHKNHSLLSGEIKKNHQENTALIKNKQEETIKLMEQLSFKLEETVRDVSPTIIQEAKPILNDIAEAKGANKEIFEQLKDLNDSIISQINNLTQVNEELQKSTLQALNSVYGELESLIDNNFVDFKEKSKERLKQLTNKLETKLKQIVNEISETYVNKQIVKALHQQLLNEVHAFRESNKLIIQQINKNGKAINHSTESVSNIIDIIRNGQSDHKKFVEHQIIKHGRLVYNKLDALLSIHNLIKLNSPLPIMHEWRISSDYGNVLIKAFLSIDKGIALDIGSGVSTILLGYAAKKNGAGKVISIEHSIEYYNESKKLIAEHGLEDYCILYHSPLIEYKINNKKWLWYDIKKANLPKDIALISIDGPPGNTQDNARYPALPLLMKHISSKTKIFLDDGNREDESKVVKRWAKEFNLRVNINNNNKGYYYLEIK